MVSVLNSSMMERSLMLVSREFNSLLLHSGLGTDLVGFVNAIQASVSKGLQERKMQRFRHMLERKNAGHVEEWQKYMKGVKPSSTVGNGSEVSLVCRLMTRAMSRLSWILISMEPLRQKMIILLSERLAACSRSWYYFRL